jgi:hypothetical protein
MDHESIDWTAEEGAAPPPNVAPDTGLGMPRGPLQPMWQLPHLQRADGELLEEAVALSQLRSHALANPSVASFKDAARFLAYIAIATGGMGRRIGASIPMPAVPILQMTVRTMTERPQVRQLVSSIFTRLCVGTAEMPDATLTTSSPESPLLAPSRGPQGTLLMRGSTFRTFFAEALKIVSHAFIDDDLAERVVDCEWRSAKGHSSVSAATKPLGSGTSWASGATFASASSMSSSTASSLGATGVPLPAFMDKLTTFALLFVANGFAFASPVEEHVCALLSYLALCIPRVAMSPKLFSSKRTTTEQPNLTVPYSGEASVTSAAPASQTFGGGPQRPPSQGFLPPGRPLTQRPPPALVNHGVPGRATKMDNIGATPVGNGVTAPHFREVPQMPRRDESALVPADHTTTGMAANAVVEAALMQGTFSSSMVRLPLILTRRHVDDHTPDDDMGDAAVGVSVTNLAPSVAPAAGSVGGGTSPRAPFYSSTINSSATSLRKALHVFELYPHASRSNHSALSTVVSQPSRSSHTMQERTFEETVIKSPRQRQAGGREAASSKRKAGGGSGAWKTSASAGSFKASIPTFRPGAVQASIDDTIGIDGRQLV